MSSVILLSLALSQGQFAGLELQLQQSPTIKKMQAEIDELKLKVARCPCSNSQLSGTAQPATVASGTQPQLVQICENGVCRLVPVAGSTSQLATTPNMVWATPFATHPDGSFRMGPGSEVGACDGGDCSGGNSGGFFKRVGRGLFGKKNK